MKSRLMKAYFDQLESQRKDFFQYVTNAIDNPWERPQPKNLDDKYSMKEIQALLSNETEKLYKQLADIEEPIAGQIRYPDPVADYPNVMQSVHLLAIHENHHFDLTKKYYEKQ